MPNLPTSISAAFSCVIALACTVSTMSAHATQDEPSVQPQTAKQDSAPTDPKWLERLPKEDRAAIDEVVGFAPPPFTGDLKWVNGEAFAWEAHRGKVILLQSFTTGNPAARKWPMRLSGMAKDWPADQVVIIALHTPEDADKAEVTLQKQRAPKNVAIVIDSKGDFCNALGVYREPVNFIIDRNGVVRFAGLNAKGTTTAMDLLLKESNDPSVIAKQRPSQATPASSAPASFPPFKEKIDNARDIRGQRAPDFFVDEWITSQPQARDKVVVIDFWATWCGPCVASIPHMNNLATKFGDQVCIIAISDEKQNDFEAGLKKIKLKTENFKYALALDSAAKMKSAIQIRGIPHCIVMSRDWIVRWQGHPMSLRPQTLEQIIKADSSTGDATPTHHRRWQTGR
jgi:thiol-disulfide isomerase/thioredoxin